MNKHTSQLEILVNKFQVRFGVDDELVQDLHAEIIKRKQAEEWPTQSNLRDFQPHEVHTIRTAEVPH